MAGKEDRRVKYTKALLRDALVEMLKERHISQVSIKALCEAADVNRSTFYAHYADQYDLLHQLEQEMLQNVTQYLEAAEYSDRLPLSYQTLKKILEYIRANADIFKVLLSENSSVNFSKDIMKLAQILAMPATETTDRRTVEYITVFGTTGCVSVLSKWLQDGMPESTDEITDLIMALLNKGAMLPYSG